MYERKVASNGRVMWFREGKLVKHSEVPAELMDTILEESSDELPVNKRCIFCQQFADSQRFVNGKTYPLCEVDYNSRTLGEVAEQARRNAEA